MPIHDWTRVDKGTFHDFHTSWLVCLKKHLNSGGLPDGYSARLERHTGRPTSKLLGHAAWANGPVTVAVRQDGTKRLTVVIEVGSPSNPDSADEFVRKVQTLFHAGVHILLLDVLPTTTSNSAGLIELVCKALNGAVYLPPTDKPLAVLSCCAGPNDFYIHPLAIGDELPGVPLFLTPDVFVDLPLAATYALAFQSMPSQDRRTLTP